MSRLHLQGVSDSVKLAREHALLGNYSVSLAYYDSVMDQVYSYLNEPTSGLDEQQRTQWAQSKQRLRQEYQIIQSIQNELNLFSSGLTGGAGTSISTNQINNPYNSNNGGSSRMKPLPKFFEEPSEKNSGGGVAFVVNTVTPSSNNMSDDPFGGRAKTPNFNQQQQNQDGYDPDVWLPPTPQQPGAMKPQKRLQQPIEKKPPVPVANKPVNNRVGIRSLLFLMNVDYQLC